MSAPKWDGLILARNGALVDEVNKNMETKISYDIN